MGCGGDGAGAGAAGAEGAGLAVLDLTASNPTQCGFVYDEAGILAALGDRGGAGLRSGAAGNAAGEGGGVPVLSVRADGERDWGAD